MYVRGHTQACYGTSLVNRKKFIKTERMKRGHSSPKLESTLRPLGMTKLSRFYLFALLVTVGSVVHLSLAQSNCGTLSSSCADCISAGQDCQWCSTPLNTKCQARTSSSQSCAAADVVDPRSTLVNTVNLSVDVGQNQVSVESVRLRLRVGEPQTFRVSVRAQENFPLDLYMLMDLSASFAGDLDTVKNIAPQIVSAVGNLTSRFQVGFGTFVDKTTAPFNAPLALSLGHTLTNGQPSACSGMPCSRPISYEHVVNLTNSTDLFGGSVQDLVISTSSDDQEGTLDAMMQAVICTNVVGWREEARKVLMVMTDDLMHVAGDGRLAGIYRPNDAKCRTQFDPTENKTLYSASLEFDFPTVEQMRMVLEEYGVVPVFAVSGQQDYFAGIAQTFRGFSEELESNADNLVSVIELVYNDLVNSSRLEFPLPDYLQVEITTECPPGSTATGNNGCSGIGNDLVNFTVSVTLTKCPDELRNFKRQTFTAFARPAFGRFTLEVEGHCSCDCEKTTVPNHMACTGNGNLTCGQCTCDEQWSGDDCSCSRASCPSTMSGECSGSSRGECECAECRCKSGQNGQRFFGDTCQCDNRQCVFQSEGQFAECSNRGTCECNGGCTCGTSNITGLQHLGAYCQCNSESCVSPNDNCRKSANGSCQVCNGRGSCMCGPTGSRCDCNSPYVGEYCQVNSAEIMNCAEAAQNCIMCYGEAAEQETTDTTGLCPTLSCPNYTPLFPAPNGDGYSINNTIPGTTRQCSIFDGMCTFNYYEASTASGANVFEVLPRTCLPLPSYGIALVILFALLLLGILILICVKLIYVWLDYREVRRLNLEVQNTKFTTYQSPLYHDPNVTYTNVKYGKEE